MPKFSDKNAPFDPMALLGRPTFQITGQYDRHTQIQVPWQQAFAAAWARFLGYVAWGTITAVTGIAAWQFAAGHRLVGTVAVAAVIILIVFALVSRGPRRLFIKRMESEVKNPFSDDTLLAMMQERLRQLQPPPPQIVREAVPYPVPESQMRYNGKQQVGPYVTIADLIEFARGAQVRGVARRAWCGGASGQMSRARWEQITHRFLEAGDLRKGGDGAAEWVRPVEYIIAELKVLLEEPIPCVGGKMTDDAK